MIKLDEILNEWTKDCVIDQTQLGNEIVRIPQLHAKYLQILTDHKLSSLRNKFEYDRLKNIKTEYYLGHLDKETLDQYGWEQFDLKIGTKGNVDRYINSDNQLIKLLQKKSYHDQAITTCEQILNEIKNRSWQVKTLVDHNKFISGA
jgi:hypothetical protein